MATFFLIGRFIHLRAGDGQWARLLRENLLIGGWVALWKPLEIFLYDWWPIVGERRHQDRLSRIKVRIVYAVSPPTKPRAFADGDTSLNH